MLTTTYTPMPGTADGIAGSLRADIVLANADTGSQPDIIQLAAGMYNLTSASGQLAITNTSHTLIIDGAGMGATTIDQHFVDRVFATAAGTTVIFENLEITGGTAETDSAGGATEADGGGILNLGSLTLTSVEVDLNKAQAPSAGENAKGGGIYSTGPTTINGGSVISNNNADAATGGAGSTGGYSYGGGIFVDTVSATTITNTTIGGNDALAGTGGAGTSTDGGTAGIAYGGGVSVFSAGPNTTLNDDVIAGNTAQGGNGGAGAAGFHGGPAEFAEGGGIVIDNAGSDVISNCTVSGNMVIGGDGGAKGAGGSGNGIGGLALGGGIELQSDSGPQLLNDTVYGNTATGGTGSNSGSSYGGGIDDDASFAVKIVNLTVAANTAAVVAPVSGGTAGTPFGGGIDNNTSETPGDTALDVYNTLDATNTAAGSPDFKGAAAIANSNLLGDGTGATGFGVVSDNNKVGTSGSPINPLFAVAALTGNGGNTQTVVLQAGSPALAAGNVAAATAAGLTTDQRGTGFARIVNGAVDIGAVENQAAATTTSIVVVPNPANLGQSVTFTAIVSPAGGATGTPTGTVQFKDGSTDIGPAETLALTGGSYQAAYSTSSLTAGPHTITAVYSGDTNFSTSTSPNLSESVGAAATSTTILPIPNPATFGTSVTFTATVVPTGGATGTPAGTVQFEDAGTNIGPAETVNGSGQATFITSSLAVGSHLITAVYTSSNTANFTGSTATGVSEVINSGTQTLDLSTDYNLAGITTDGTSFSGGLDGQGHAFSESLVGTSLLWNGLTFPIAAPNVNDVIQATGQTITLPAASYSGVAFLATGTNGNQPNQTFTVNYTTGSPTVVSQSISDWHMPQNYTGESIALTTGYRNVGNGNRDTAGPFIVYGYTIAVDPTRTVSSITLPNDSHVKLLSIATVAPLNAPTSLTATSVPGSGVVNLAWTATASTITGYNVYRGTTAGGEATTPIASLSPTTTTYADSTGLVAGNTYYYTVKAINYPAASAASNEANVTMSTTGSSTQVDLAGVYNLMGVTKDGSQYSGGLDGHGNAFSANVLGTSQTAGGVTFTTAQGNSNNVVQAAGQTIGLPLSSTFTHVEMLTTAVNGNQPGQTFTVNYTNGTSQTFNQGVSDWHTPQGYLGESVAVSASYRDTPSGGTDTKAPFDIYNYSFALTVPAGFDIQSITLPNNQHVEVFAITVS